MYHGVNSQLIGYYDQQSVTHDGVKSQLPRYYGMNNNLPMYQVVIP